MNPEFAVEMVKAMIFQALTLAAPILLTALVVGLGISLFQAVTSIHEQTLSFVPKVLGIVVVMVIALPWMLRSSMEFTTMLIEKMPQMVR
ncbi:MAG: flagellar biosynthesis protein FliQ [Limisphaerales bacterium]